MIIWDLLSQEYFSNIIYQFFMISNFQDNTLYHLNTQKCAEVSLDGKNLTMKACTGIDRQLWQWKRKPPTGVIPP